MTMFSWYKLAWLGVDVVEVVDAVVADVAAEKNGVEKIKLVLYF